jgi:hypothetical protein
VNIESSFGSHDPLIEGAMFDNWEAAVDVNEGTSPGDNATVTVTANITSPLSASTGTISIPSASPDFFAPVRVGSFVQLSGSGSPDVDGFYLVTAKPAIGNLTVQPSPPVSTSGAFRVRSSGIRNGIIFKSFLIEKEFRDVAQFFAFSGMRVGVWAETIAPGAILTGNFGFQGETVVTAQASIFSSSPTVESLIATNDVFNAVDNIDNVLINGVDQSATLCFTEISFSLDNQLRALPCIGQLENFDIGAGQVAVTGTLVSYFENLLLYNQFRNFTNVRLSFTATDLNGNTYLYFFPNFKLTSGEVIAGGNNTDVLASFEYTVRRDPTFGFAMGVNRFANTRSELLPGTADQA